MNDILARVTGLLSELPALPAPKTLVCHPSVLANLSASGDCVSGLAGIAVQTSPWLPEGTAYLMDTSMPRFDLEQIVSGLPGYRAEPWRTRDLLGVGTRVDLGWLFGIRRPARRVWRPRPRPGIAFTYCPTPWLASPARLPIDGAAYRRRKARRR